MQDILKILNDNPLPIYPNSGLWFELGPYEQPDGSLIPNNASSLIGIGPVNFVRLDPGYSQNGRVFKGGWGCGLFVSENFGLSWNDAGASQLTSSISAADVASFHIQDQNNTNVWILIDGDGDAGYNFSSGKLSRGNGSFEPRFAHGVWRSVDEGRTWVLIGEQSDFNGAVSNGFTTELGDYEMKRLPVTVHLWTCLPAWRMLMKKIVQTSFQVRATQMIGQVYLERILAFLKKSKISTRTMSIKEIRKG